MPLESCTGGHRASKSSRDPKSVDLTMPLESSKSSRDPKTVDYSPRKRPEMTEISSFGDAARVVYGGSQGIEILPGPENHGL